MFLLVVVCSFLLLSWEPGVIGRNKGRKHEETFNGRPCMYELERNFDLEKQKRDRNTGEIRAAVILPSDYEKYEVTLSRVMPVLLLAERAVHKMNILPGLHFNFMPSNGRCEAVYAQYRAIEAYAKSNVHVFFGPTCEYSVAPIARMVKFWSTPLLTTGALTFDFSKNKTHCDSEYHLLVRVGLYSFRDMAAFLVSVMERYKWYKVMLVYDKDGCGQISGKHTCKLMMETFVEQLKGKGNFHYGSFDLEKNKDSLQDNLRREIGSEYTSQSV
ncbi:atrial natriuretic peptide receptor 3 [Lycorma delicatula]|uniref:atrial natriuretic peptide receptor 3 n=1 Tax=Lycorma delicatula TaxID=130591 RepID=UPI003F50F26D